MTSMEKEPILLNSHLPSALELDTFMAQGNDGEDDLLGFNFTVFTTPGFGDNFQVPAMMGDNIPCPWLDPKSEAFLNSFLEIFPNDG